MEETECNCGSDLSSVYDRESELEKKLQFDRIEENGTYLAMVVKQMNERIVPVVTNGIIPAVTMAFAIAGWAGTMGLGAIVLAMKLY